MNWTAVVEIWSTESLLFVPELPGYLAKSPDAESLVSLAESSIPGYLDWLIEGELIEERPDRIGVDVGETSEALSGKGPCFQLDRTETSLDLREMALAVGRACLSDVLFVYDDVPEGDKPRAAKTLRHIAEMDRWYATRMAPAQGTPFMLLEDELVQSASLLEETIDLIAEADRPSTWIIDGEEWSIGKVLRRRTSHLREHLPELLMLLS